MTLACQWAAYKGLFHTECNSFLTTTICGEVNYTFEEIPIDGNCPNCGRTVNVIERQFGRKGSR
jgi:rubredoxin